LRAIYFEKDVPRALVVKALRQVWPGVVYSPISPTRFVEMPSPPLPGPRWLRVKNRQCGICASDLSLVLVDAEPDTAPVVLPGYQRIYLGHEALGHIVETAPGVTHVKVGDRVMMDTRFNNPTCLSQEIDPPCRHCARGDYALCENASANLGAKGVGGGWGDEFTAHETEVYRVPDDLTDDQAMMIEPISTGLRAVLRRPPEAGQHALVVGGGIIGLSTLECARAIAPDCHLTISVRHPHQAEMARRLGADEVWMREDVYRETARLTGAKLYHGLFNTQMLLGGFDVIYDCVGSAVSVQDSLRWARARGSVVLIGVKMKRLHVDMNPIWHQEVDLSGVFAHGIETWQGTPRHTYDIVIELMRQGKLTADGLITHRFPLEQWKQAIATALDKRSGSIKVVFDCQ
jgi:L-iditol 2-dehydrogenase